MSKRKKIALIDKDCVACGCCVRVCPRGALSVYKGFLAKVAQERCIGCGKCADACPAQVISMVERGNAVC